MCLGKLIINNGQLIPHIVHLDIKSLINVLTFIIIDGCQHIYHHWWMSTHLALLMDINIFIKIVITRWISMLTLYH